MCGFAGIASTRSAPDRDLVCAMRDTLIHRGPDDAGIYVDRHVGLGFRRLSIIDLAHGTQPMSDERGGVWVVFNGEIYNYVELRRELEMRGYVFKTQSDTETIVHGYREYGTEVFSRLNGMFAIAVWDRDRKRLILARDRAGEKPLHYCLLPEGLVFGSELKALLRHPGVSRAIDWRAFDEFFTFGYIPAPKTIYANIRKVLPGHYMVYENNALSEHPYWALDPTKRYSGGYEDAKSECLALLEDAVRIRMRSDVPLGGFLSGGIDSSAVVGLMARNSNRPVKSFTVTFGESDFNESRFARLVAERWHTEHTEVVVTPEHFLDNVEAVLMDFDEPFGDSSALPTYMVSKITRRHVTVSLSGDGGDEIFGGYWDYASALQMQAKLRWFPAFTRPFAWLGARCTDSRSKLGRWMRILQESDEERFLTGLTLFNPQSKPVKSELFTSEAYSRVIEPCPDLARHRDLFRRYPVDPVKRLQYMDFMDYLPDDILVKVDRTSMLVSLEARTPYLDHRLIEFAFSLPTEWHVTASGTKLLLKDILRDLVPAPILTRKKMGFAVPVRYWFQKGHLRPFYDRLFSSDMQHYFNTATIRRYLSEHESQKEDHSGKLWHLLSFALWLQRNHVS
jgi:asparagine synthase (glutamine-hydrolysing)